MIYLVSIRPSRCTPSLRTGSVYLLLQCYKGNQKFCQIVLHVLPWRCKLSGYRSACTLDWKQLPESLWGLAKPWVRFRNTVVVTSHLLAGCVYIFKVRQNHEKISRLESLGGMWGSNPNLRHLLTMPHVPRVSRSPVLNCLSFQISCYR